MLIIIDNIYIGVVNNCFSQICNRVMALDSCQNLVFTQYLENVGIDREIKFCIFIIIDKINIGDLNHCCCLFCKFATGLRPLIDARFWFLLNVLITN